MPYQQTAGRPEPCVYPIAQQIGAARKASLPGSIFVQLRAFAAAYYWAGDDHSAETHRSSLRCRLQTNWTRRRMRMVNWLKIQLRCHHDRAAHRTALKVRTDAPCANGKPGSWRANIAFAQLCPTNGAEMKPETSPQLSYKLRWICSTLRKYKNSYEASGVSVDRVLAERARKILESRHQNAAISALH